MPLDATFDARTVEPRQSGGKHQVGNKWQGIITNTLVKPTKDQKGGIFEVEFSSPGGTIKNNYNIWNESEAARNIAKQQLSALCHATGIFQIDFKNDGAALRGGKLLYDVGFQAGQEPSAEKPEGGYVEVKKIYDINGNDSWGGQQQQQQPSNGSTRYHRLISRGRSDAPRDLEEFEERDRRELGWGLGETITLAEVMLVNEGTLEEFREASAALLRRLG